MMMLKSPRARIVAGIASLALMASTLQAQQPVQPSVTCLSLATGSHITSFSVAYNALYQPYIYLNYTASFSCANGTTSQCGVCVAAILFNATNNQTVATMFGPLSFTAPCGAQNAQANGNTSFGPVNRNTTYKIAMAFAQRGLNKTCPNNINSYTVISTSTVTTNPVKPL